MQNNYTPFDKNFEDLRVFDLEVLKGVHEGWYVEYKSEMVNASAMAKAISAFANTYGGWLFIGISEKSKDNNVAGEFIGLSSDNKDKIRQKIRSALAANVQPTPFYEIKFLDDPKNTIGLPKEKSILVIHTPSSPQAPHVHKDGRIYKRVSDSSEPKPETDPHLLSQIWNRREKSDAIIKDWIDDHPEFSEGESKNPYLRVLLTPDDWGQSQVSLRANMHDVRSVLHGSQEDSYHMPLQTTHLTGQGYVGRQTGGNDPYNFGVTFQTDTYLNAEFVLPFRFHRLDNTDELWLYLQGYDQTNSYVDILNKGSHKKINIIDLNHLYAGLIAVIIKYRKLQRLAGKETSYYAKVILLNGWRFHPFIDDADCISQFEKFGVPMIMSDEVIAPSGKKAGSFLEIAISHFGDEDKDYSIAATQAFKICKEVFELMGIDVFFEPEKSGERSYLDIANLLSANERANKNQTEIQRLQEERNYR